MTSSKCQETLYHIVLCRLSDFPLDFLYGKILGYMKAELTVAFWIVSYMKKNHHGGLKLRVETHYIKDYK